jgi:hypothetical protein
VETERQAAESQRQAEEVQRQAVEAQRKAAEEQLAVEAQQRRAKLEAEAQAAKAALERAEADRKRLDQELKRATLPKAGESQSPASGPAAIPPAREGKGSERFDGTYDGQFCSERPANLPGMRCFPVVLKVDRSKILATWTHKLTGKEATAQGTIAADGTVLVTLNSWLPNGKPIDGSMTGKWEKNVIALSGKWKSGLAVSGTWKRPF